MLPGNATDRNLDPITVEVVRNKFDGIANEMQATLIRSAFSSIVKEGMDGSASLFTLKGETLAQALAIPIHLATMIPMVRTILSTFPPDSMKAGEVYLMNDPYMGGTHLPDIILLSPAFCGERIVGFAATIAHHQDVGGLAPGSIPTNSTEIFQEGLRLPPVRYRDSSGAINDLLTAIMAKNVRVPDIFFGDLNAQLAACMVGVKRLTELSNKLGFELTTSIIDELLDRSESLTRSALANIPEGTYEHTDFLDNDGVDIDRRVPIKVAVTVRDGKFSCDFTGSSEQVRGPFNAVPSGALAAACFSIRTLTDPTIPTNGGCFRPIELHLPKGTIVNPIEPAPVCSRTATIKKITAAIVGAIRPAIEAKVPADSAGVALLLSFGGKNLNGTPYVMGEVVVSGTGAGCDVDGTDIIDTDASNSTNNPVEAIEASFPLRIHRYGYRMDSGGPGRFRGGLGCVREYEVLRGPITFTHRGERHFVPARGYKGGADGALARSVIIRANGSEEVIPSKCVTRLETGDRVLIETAGGGGWGEPKERSHASIIADVAHGKISGRAAAEEYGHP